jgi:hypothetical protein
MSSKKFALALGCAVLGACGGTKVITLKQINLDGNSEYWVCDASANTCQGEHAGDIDPAGYQARAEVHAPPKQCVNGVANIDIVLDGSDVKRVRYECAQRALPAPSGGAGGAGPGTGLPPAVPGPGTGLPPSVPGPGTGLPASGGSGGGHS